MNYSSKQIQWANEAYREVVRMSNLSTSNECPDVKRMLSDARGALVNLEQAMRRHNGKDIQT